MQRIRRRSTLAAGLVGLALLVSAAAPALADDEGTARTGGLGAAAALCSLVYGPVKIVYAGGGLIIGGLAWVFSAGDYDVARPILNASVRGDYVITPDHLTGRRPVEFIGRPPADRKYGSETGGF